MNRQQQDVIEYLQEKVRALREQLGKRPRFNDPQRRWLAAKAKKINLDRLQQIATVVTPRTLLNWHQRLIAHNTISAAAVPRAGVLRQRKSAI
jgi:hypothetical protein